MIPSSSSDVAPAIKDAAVDGTNGYYGLGIMIIIFVFLAITLFREDEVFRLDLVRSIMFSSLFTLVIGIVLLATDFVTSFRHVVWFGIIFLLSVISLYYKKRKGL